MPATSKKQNKVGQAMGAKGLETYRSIIDTTMTLLAKTPYMELSAADVARGCGLTPPALYLYFNGIPEIVLARLAEIKSSEHPYAKHLNQLWEGSDALGMARAFMMAHVTYWRAHGVALRYRNFMSEQGDKRFQEARGTMSLPLAEALAGRVADGQKRGSLPASLEPYAAAGAILALIDHVAGVLTAPVAKWNNQYLKLEPTVEAVSLMMLAILQGGAPVGRQLPARRAAARRARQDI